MKTGAPGRGVETCPSRAAVGPLLLAARRPGRGGRGQGAAAPARWAFSGSRCPRRRRRHCCVRVSNLESLRLGNNEAEFERARLPQQAVDARGGDPHQRVHRLEPGTGRPAARRRLSRFSRGLVPRGLRLDAPCEASRGGGRGRGGAGLGVRPRGGPRVLLLARGAAGVPGPGPRAQAAVGEGRPRGARRPPNGPAGSAFGIGPPERGGRRGRGRGRRVPAHSSAPASSARGLLGGTRLGDPLSSPATRAPRCASR